jgi:predicted nucleic acid-binding protein
MSDNRRVFVDSNVLVYSYDASSPSKHERARSVVDELWREHRGALSVQVLQEFFVTATRKLRDRLPVADARRIVANLGSWRTHEPNAQDVLEAIDIHRDHQVSFWDAMVIRSAAALECDVLLTEDLNAGQIYRGVRVDNPFAQTDES